jgi:hypothetical protein
VERTGDGHGSGIRRTVDSLLFGVVPVFASRQIELEIDNEGNEPLTVSPGDVHRSVYDYAQNTPGAPGDWDCAPGATKVFFVRYSPMDQDGTHETADWALGRRSPGTRRPRSAVTPPAGTRIR